MAWHRELLIGFDLETTGTDPYEARIVTGAVIEVKDGEPLGSRDWLADPGVEIPADAVAVHGISTERAVAEGRPADLLVLERRRQDPYENVLDADPSWVELVTIDGQLAYGRADWFAALAAPAADGGREPLLAWGKEMLLDTSSAAPAADVAPTLAQLRAALISSYPQVGPIFA
jgi:hypothetical protein